MRIINLSFTLFFGVFCGRIQGEEVPLGSELEIKETPTSLNPTDYTSQLPLPYSDVKDSVDQRARKPPSHDGVYSQSYPENYNQQPVEAEVYKQPETKVKDEGEYGQTNLKAEFSFIKAFDDIKQSMQNYQASLTHPMSQLVKEATGLSTLTICKLGRTRIILTKAWNKLFESYSHWVKLGTSQEGSHCREDARNALVAFVGEVDKVARDLSSLDQSAVGDEAFAYFKQLESSTLKTIFQFGIPQQSKVSEQYAYEH